MSISTKILRGIAASALVAVTLAAHTQAPPPTRQSGTVKAIAGNAITLTTPDGKDSVIIVDGAAKILQVAPDSRDLKSATPIALTDISAGDKVLLTGAPNPASGFTATRVILMKSTDIAQKHAAEQADWQRRGLGGIVSAVSPDGTITVSSGARKLTVATTPTTIFRRYSGDSIKFEDAKPGTLAQIQTGDQMRVRGAKSEDGLSIAAEEIVSGSFKNLAGTISAIDVANGTVTLRDLATKKIVTVKVTANSDQRKLPPQAAAMFAARAAGGPPAATTPGAPADSPRAPRPAGSPRPEGATPNGPGPNGGQGARSASMDLSQMLARLPVGTLADLHNGDAVMIVASQTGTDTLTAVTLLSGVEPILAASPGTPTMTISPWGVGGDAPGGGQ